MSIKGVPQAATVGIKGTKPRLRIPKVPRTKETDETVALGVEYLERRNRIMAIKEKQAALELAFARDQLIEKALVERQLAYFLIPFRQAVAAIPTKLRRALGERFSHEMGQVAKRIAHETLETLSRLPEAVEPGWQERLEEEN
jgi:hypothetical protein